MSAFFIRRQTDRITLILWACVSMPNYSVPTSGPTRQAVKLKFSARDDASLLPKRSASAPARCITEKIILMQAATNRSSRIEIAEQDVAAMLAEMQATDDPEKFRKFVDAANLRSKQRGPQRKTERERNFSPALRIIYL
jgi:hypothetical protein